MIQCSVRANEGVKVGKQIRNLDKLIWGVSTFIILIALLLGPILLFSTLNPTNIFNDVYGASVSLILCFQSGETSYNNFTLFKSDSIDTIKKIGKIFYLFIYLFLFICLCAIKLFELCLVFFF